MSEITPDTRDWTDVLAGGCSECGFTGTEDPTVVPATLAEADDAVRALTDKIHTGHRQIGTMVDQG